MGDSIWGLVSAFAFCLGAYSIYSFIVMKTRGLINTGFLLGKNYAGKRCKDKEAYMKRAGIALLVLGITGIVFGVVDFIHLFVIPMSAVDNVVLFLFFVVLLWFGGYTTKLKKTYW